MTRLSLGVLLLTVTAADAQNAIVAASTNESPGQAVDAPQLAPLPRTVAAPKDNPTTPAKVELGKMLFFDPRLSGGNEMSCATCHIPEKAFGDGLPLSPGKATP